MAPPLPHLERDAQVPLASAFQWQQDRCTASGSPIAAAVLNVCAGWAQRCGPQVGLPLDSVRFGDHIPLRLMAAVHFLAITRAAARLAMYFPTLGGQASTASTGDAMFHDLVSAALDDNHETVRDFMARAPQTNEPGRVAVLHTALTQLGASQQIDLHELGCSAGLNLVQASAGPLARHIAAAAGCDVEPVDVLTVQGRSLLSSYIWVDDIDRFNRLGDTITRALAHPPTIIQLTASRYLADLQPMPGHTTVLWQSALAPYLDADEHAALEEQVALLAARMPAGSRLAYATWEDAGDSTDPMHAFALRLRTWRNCAHRGKSACADSAHRDETDSATAAGACESSDSVIARGSSHGAHIVLTTGQ